MATDFSNYDSSDFGTISESVAHSKSNPLLLENLSDKLIYTYNGAEVLVQEPKCALKDLIFFFDDIVQDISVPSNEMYRPEITAKRLYGSADLWYILLLLNNMNSVMEYTKTTIKYIPSDDLTHLETFVRMSENKTRVVVENDLSDYDI